MAEPADAVVNTMVFFEIHVLGKDDWELYARFGSDAGRDPIAEAREVEQREGRAAKVVRESFDPVRNRAEEATVWISETIRKQSSSRSVDIPSNRTEEADAPGKSGKSGAKKAYGPSKRKSKGSDTGLILKRVTLILALCLALAVGVTSLTLFAMDQLPTFRFYVITWRESDFLFLVFLLSFLFTAVPLSMIYVPTQGKRARKWSLLDLLTPWRKRKPAPKPTKRSAPTKAHKTSSKLADPNDPWAHLLDEEPDDPEVLSDLTDDSDLTDLFGVHAQMAQEKANPDLDQLPLAPETTPLQTAMDLLRAILDALLHAFRDTGKRMDRHNKFGLSLMLAGASEDVGRSLKLGVQDRLDALRDALHALGTSDDGVSSFLSKLADYQREPAYAAVMRDGAHMAQALGRSGKMDPAHTKEVIANWNRPRSAVAAPSIMTIMFTDIVDSTAMTQDMGDDVAQLLVRTHNSVVRTALNEFAGKEIKHTGDGIMASFGAVNDALAACIAIQRGVAAYNSKNPGMDLHLRIGLNAGEPVKEEQDLFGTAVQLSARVTAQAGAGEIYVSSSVQQLCNKDKYKPQSVGKRKLKGFKEDQEIFEIPWR